MLIFLFHGAISEGKTAASKKKAKVAECEIEVLLTDVEHHLAYCLASSVEFQRTEWKRGSEQCQIRNLNWCWSKKHNPISKSPKPESKTKYKWGTGCIPLLCRSDPETIYAMVISYITFIFGLIIGHHNMPPTHFCKCWRGRFIFWCKYGKVLLVTSFNYIRLDFPISLIFRATEVQKCTTFYDECGFFIQVQYSAVILFCYAPILAE